MLRSNEKVVLAYVEAFNRWDIEGLCRLFTPDALIYGVFGWGPLEKIQPIWAELFESFQIQLEVESILEEGDAVAMRYVERGTSVKPFRGKPATGRPYEIIAMEWFELKGGLIHRRWGARDMASQFKQMGLPLDL
ncbi:MAG TPA: ester cyclase [bacterium]|nr:ester cyclase [bacterium]HOL95794.1 ester cyclase [bacterium]HPP01567.1 ester cyclase [bacterium]HXK93546.1 ester cyclase [bacterium]